jgi:hypothetical protein
VQRDADDLDDDHDHASTADLDHDDDYDHGSTTDLDHDDSADYYEIDPP